MARWMLAWSLSSMMVTKWREGRNEMNDVSTWRQLRWRAQTTCHIPLALCIHAEGIPPTTIKLSSVSLFFYFSFIWRSLSLSSVSLSLIFLLISLFLIHQLFHSLLTRLVLWCWLSWFYCYRDYFLIQRLLRWRLRCQFILFPIIFFLRILSRFFAFLWEETKESWTAEDPVDPLSPKWIAHHHRENLKNPSTSAIILEKKMKYFKRKPQKGSQ